MKNNTEKGVDLSLRQFIKSLGYIAGGSALLASTPWLTSCTPEKLKEISSENQEESSSKHQEESSSKHQEEGKQQ